MLEYEHHRHMMRRKTDIDWSNAEMRNDNSCPMTPESVKKMLSNQEEVITRLEKIEKTMFAGRVALSTAACIAVGALSTFEWFRSNITAIRDVFK